MISRKFFLTNNSSLDAYKDQLVTWLDRKGEKVSATAVRPNVECTNGIIHVVDRVFIDDAPPWTVGAAGGGPAAGHYILFLATLTWLTIRAF